MRGDGGVMGGQLRVARKYATRQLSGRDEVSAESFSPRGREKEEKREEKKKRKREGRRG